MIIGLLTVFVLAGDWGLVGIEWDRPEKERITLHTILSGSGKDSEKLELISLEIKKIRTLIEKSQNMGKIKDFYSTTDPNNILVGKVHENYERNKKSMSLFPLTGRDFADRYNNEIDGYKKSLKEALSLYEQALKNLKAATTKGLTSADVH